jgi:ribosomal protein S18 acetylase RimI-like enzyme
LPSDRAQLIDILSQGAGFRAPEVACAIELLDAALAPAEREVGDREAGDRAGDRGAGQSDGYEARVAVSDDSERVLGYACFGATPMTEAAYDLYWLVVAEDARGQGIGGALAAAVERELKERGGRVVRVETSSLEGQGGARRFYEKAGYRISGVIPDFYRDGDDLLVFAKVL